MTTTIAEERDSAKRDQQEGMWAVFRGRNGIRFLIAAWPKITQQLVGLSVFNTYATYFCKLDRASFTFLNFTNLFFFKSNTPATKIPSSLRLSFPQFNFSP